MTALVMNTAAMANALTETEPELAQRALDAVNEYRTAVENVAKGDLKLVPLQTARQGVIDINSELMAACNDQLDVASAVEVHKATGAVATSIDVDKDFVGQRLHEAEKFEMFAIIVNRHAPLFVMVLNGTRSPRGRGDSSVRAAGT